MTAPKRAQCEVLFDDDRIIVKALQRQCATWIAVLPGSAEDGDLGQRVLDAWQLFVKIDPSEVDMAEVDKANEPICRLFGQEPVSEIRSVAAICGRASIVLPPSELKDGNRLVIASQRIELPHGASASEIGAAVRQAMALTLS